jgi:hypothetical protein
MPLPTYLVPAYTAPPSNYDVVNLTVHPASLSTVGDEVVALLNAVADALTSVYGTLDNLNLGWAGQSAAEAQDFFARWIGVMWSLFGDGTDQRPGLAGELVSALSVAAGNFDNQENAIVTQFGNFQKAMTATGGTGDGTDVLSSRGEWTSAVGIVYWKS